MLDSNIYNVVLNKIECVNWVFIKGNKNQKLHLYKFTLTKRKQQNRVKSIYCYYPQSFCGNKGGPTQ